MAKPKVATTPIDIAASTAGTAFLQWLDVIPTILEPVRTEAEQQRAAHLADVVEQQVTEIRRLKAGQ